MEEKRHLLVYAVVFGVDDGGRVIGWAHGGGVHICDEVVVVGLFGPEVGAGVGVLARWGLVCGPEGDDAEDSVGECCDGA